MNIWTYNQLEFLFVLDFKFQILDFNKDEFIPQ